MSTPRALEGVRVLAAEDFLVLPWASMLLGDLGAEVIRIEGPSRVVSRRFVPFPESEPGPQWWEESGTHHLWYRNKRSAAINLQSPRGRSLLQELVKLSDVVASNFRADVTQRLGLEYEVLRRVKPDLVMVNVTGFGQTGPWRTYGAFARTIDGFTGLSHLTGYAGGPPVRANPSFMDMTGALNNAQAILLGLLHRDATGQGIHVDASMYETGITAIGPALLEAQRTGASPPRSGNQQDWMAPHGCYPCRGGDRWVVIAVGSDDAWRRLRGVMAEPDWAQDPRFDSTLGRWEHREELDGEMGAWTATQDAGDVFHLLQEAGLAAGPVLDGRDLLLDRHLQARGFFERHDSAVQRVGTRVYPGRPYRLSRTPGGSGPAATFGADNDYVLRELLGLSEREVDALIAEGVVATAPDAGEREPPETQRPRDLLRRHAIQRHDPDYREVLGLDEGPEA